MNVLKQKHAHEKSKAIPPSQKVPWKQGTFFMPSIAVLDIGIKANSSLRAAQRRSNPHVNEEIASLATARSQ
jgi:hypothetical protein